MKNDLLEKRERQVKIAVGPAAIDGGKPSNFTKNYVIITGSISRGELGFY